MLLSEMKKYKNWVAYRLQKNAEGRMTKIPYNPKTGRGAMANNPETWGTYEEAASYAESQAQAKGLKLGQEVGCGFEFGDSPFAGIDLDHCIDDDGNLADWAADIVEAMGSYTELSPSGHGLHIIFKGEILKELADAGKQGVKVGNIELYYGAHYFTVTERIYGQAKAITEATERARKVFKKYLVREPMKDLKTPSPQLSVEVHNSPRADLPEVMFKAKNGEAIRRLYNGDTSGYKSHSDADLALCNHLSFYSGGDAAEMDRLFRQSGLMRDKWDEKRGNQTYGEMTIAKAISGTANSYNVGDTGQPPKEEPPKEEPIEREAVAYYLNDFLAEVKRNREGQAIPTGFYNLDKIFDGGLYPGLYSIGANSSVGKTTLITQMADYIAGSGRGVLIFSLEMSRNELIAKSLSRMSLLKSRDNYKSPKYAKTTRGVLIGDYNEIEADLIGQSLREYAEKIGQNLYISEGVGDIGVKEVANKVKKYADIKGIPPVVIIDYLQILAPYDFKMSDKQNTDRNILELKRLSRDLQIPIVGISSFNRENYKQPVSMASFKESGAIEYSSDVLLGAQYFGWDFKSEEKDNARQFRLNELRQKMDEKAKNGQPLEIQLKILKNRNGSRGSIYFDFYPRFNYFYPSELEIWKLRGVEVE